MFEHNIYSKGNRTIIVVLDRYPETVKHWECNVCFKVFDTPLESFYCDVCMCEIFQQPGRAQGRRLTFHSAAFDVDTAVRHTESLIKHITYVREAGEKLGVDKAQLEQHDFSKWSYDEFLPYAINFQGDKSPVLKGNVKEDFARAWLHHVHHNPHHWQHWIFPDGYSPKDARIENGVMIMQRVCPGDDCRLDGGQHGLHRLVGHGRLAVQKYAQHSPALVYRKVRAGGAGHAGLC